MAWAESTPDPPLPLTPERLREGICVLVDFPEAGGPLFFAHPDRLLIARCPAEVGPAIRAAEEAARSGAHVAGWVAYEAASAFGLPVCEPDGTLPLVWFAVFTAPARSGLHPAPESLQGAPLRPPRPGIDRTRFQRDLETIAAWIRAGESYQVNYTLAATLEPDTDPATLFLRLQGAHRFPRAMWIQAGAWSVASFSPEVFLERHGDRLITAPIKGTRPRSDQPETDRAMALALEQSAKDRAEHVMIVDMARNDLGRICATGSVGIGPLAALRSFSTVHHLETRVHGILRPGVDLEGIFSALFPAASITGAPKQGTMEMIRTLEQRPRGIYTGAMGWIRPGGDCLWNVAIRTVVHREQRGCVIGLGGGVVADSDPEAEWEEIHAKSRFLTSPPATPELIETFRVEASGRVVLLEAHLDRLALSARALGLALDRHAAHGRVEKAGRAWAAAGLTPLAGRLALRAGGALTLTHRPLPVWPDPLLVRLANWQPDPLEALSAHKTDRRLHLDAEFREACACGCHEVLFFNRAGRLTEGAISAVLVCLEGRWWAPALAEGICPSLWRVREMAALQAREAPLTRTELNRAEAIRIGNAVRGGGLVSRVDLPGGATVWQRPDDLPPGPFDSTNG